MFELKVFMFIKTFMLFFLTISDCHTWMEIHEWPTRDYNEFMCLMRLFYFFLCWTTKNYKEPQTDLQNTRSQFDLKTRVRKVDNFDKFNSESSFFVHAQKNSVIASTHNVRDILTCDDSEVTIKRYS